MDKVGCSWTSWGKEFHSMGDTGEVDASMEGRDKKNKKQKVLGRAKWKVGLIF